MSWQPIATAPSDTVVLLYTPEIHPSNTERIQAQVYHDTRAGTKHAWATHWMPLPPFPVRPDDATAPDGAGPQVVAWDDPRGGWVLDKP